MIVEESGIFPIVVFDNDDGWDSVRKLCPMHLDSRGQKRLEDSLKNGVKCVVVEKHYIDKDYRDTFSNFHSKRFSTPNSRCIRLHFFTHDISYEDLKIAETVQDYYIGYSIIRPTRPNCIGRTFIDVKNYTGQNAYICTCSEKVNLQGTELELTGFPFISQDGDATVCAQSALWMIVRYFSNRYSLYKETYPFQLTQLSKDYSIGRISPSNGLTIWQLGESLRQLSFSPLIYNRETFEGDFDRLLYTYIESGIPVIAGVPNHVIAVFGHASDLSLCVQTSSLVFSSEFCTAWMINNDNCSPYQTLLKDGGGDSDFEFKDIDSFIAPLAEKVFLTAENFEKVVLEMLNNSQTGINKLSPTLLHDSLVLRMYLTTGKSYKKKLSKRGMGDSVVENIYRQLPLPHFIWVCELSSPAEYANGNVLGEIIWDATRNVWETEGWIAIHYPEQLLVDIGSALNGVQKIHSFDLTNDAYGYSMYCSNLKEI